MPDGKTHDKITIYVLPIILVILFLVIPEVTSMIIITVGYLFASYMFNGDLDIYSSPYKRWLMFRFIWKPYQKMFSHRSIFTHGLIIGTIVRLVYLFTIPVLISMFLGVNLLAMLMNPALILFYIGLELGSAVHTIADKTVSGVKNIRR